MGKKYVLWDLTKGKNIPVPEVNLKFEDLYTILVTTGSNFKIGWMVAAGHHFEATSPWEKLKKAYFQWRRAATCAWSTLWVEIISQNQVEHIFCPIEPRKIVVFPFHILWAKDNNNLYQRRISWTIQIQFGPHWPK